jgi:hypothetical protein
MHARQAKPPRCIGGGANRYGGLGCADECPSDAVAPLRADCGRPRMAVPPCGPPGTQPARCFTCRRVVGPQNEALKLCVSGPIVFSFVTCVERVCEACRRYLVQYHQEGQGPGHSTQVHTGRQRQGHTHTPTHTYAAMRGAQHHVNRLTYMPVCNDQLSYGLSARGGAQ